MATRDIFRQFLTNLEQPMPLPEKLSKLTGNLWRRKPRQDLGNNYVQYPLQKLVRTEKIA